LSLTAQAVTLPPAAGAFSTYPWLSPFVNIAAIPVATAAIVILGFGLVASEVSRAVGASLMAVGGFGIRLLVVAAGWVSPWSSVEVPAPDGLFATGWYCLLVGVLQLAISLREGAGARAAMGGRCLTLIGIGLLALS